MEKFLTVKELSKQIKMAPQTIYNMIHRKEFTLGIHYVKPSRKKVLFKEAAIMDWLNSPPEEHAVHEQPTNIISTVNRQKPQNSLINI